MNYIENIELIIILACGITIGTMIGVNVIHNRISICDKCKIVYDDTEMKYCTECGGELINTKEYEWKAK